MRLLFLCALRTGRRIGEVKAMRWDDLTLDDRLWVSADEDWSAKTWLRASIAAELKERWENAGKPEEGWVFPSPSKSGHIEESRKRGIRFGKPPAFRNCKLGTCAALS
jgi:integrase